MILRLAALPGIVALVWCALCAFSAQAASVTLSSGEKLEGEAVSFDERGVVLKKPEGGFRDRIGWTNLAQTTLRELVANPKAKRFVDPYIEPTEAELEAKAKRNVAIEVKPRIPDRIDRPEPGAGMGNLLSSSILLLGLALIYIGNIYAGYEMGVFRNYHPALTCGVAAILPVVGPILFLCMPTRLQKSQDQLAAESMATHMAAQQELEAAEAAANEPTPEELAAQQAAAEAAAIAAAQPKTITYTRGQVTFNRRFFETKFAGFLRVVPGEEEKDKVIYVRSARGEHTSSRLTRIDPDGLHIQIREGAATADVMIPFNEVYEVQIRPVDVGTPS